MSTPAGKFVLEVSDLRLAYVDRRGQRHVAVEAVNLAVQPGDFLCLLGPSGCGKTSLLKALGGFLPADQGGILYKGKELREPRQDIAMIFQEHYLFPWLTVEGNIAFGPRRQGVPRAERKRRAEELLKIVGMQDASQLYPQQLSGGMRQRVGIARALATQPEVLLLDEPFSALDVNLRRRMQHFLRELWARTRTTMIMVTHDIEEAILVGQRILVMRGSSPSNISERIDTSDRSLKDRYSKAFLELQAHLENLMDAADDRGEAAAAHGAQVPGGALANTV